MQNEKAILFVLAAGAAYLWWNNSQTPDYEPGITGPIVDAATSVAQWITPAAGQQYDPLFTSASLQYSLPQGLLSRVAYEESRYNADAVSSAGAQGMMQFMPATAAQFGINPFDPTQAIPAAARYLAQLAQQFAGTGDQWAYALAAYNWGPGNVSKIGTAWPTSVLNYVNGILTDIGQVGSTVSQAS